MSFYPKLQGLSIIKEKLSSKNSVIYLSKNESLNKITILKSIKKESLSSKAYEMLKREREFYSSNISPDLFPTFINPYKDDKNLYIEMSFIEGVNLENLLTVEPHSRNPVLADALKRIGLAEKTGRGIDRIFEGSIIYGRPLPDYSESTNKYVKLFIQRSEPDLPFAQMISNEENRLGRSLPINSLLILSALQYLRRASLHELAEKTHVNDVRTKANVEKLVEAGLVEAIGNTNARTYTLSSKVYRVQDNTVGYIRQTGIDIIKYEELILKLATNQNGIVTRDNVVNLLGINAAQAYRVLKKITETGKLKLVGSGRAAHYELVK